MTKTLPKTEEERKRHEIVKSIVGLKTNRIDMIVSDEDMAYIQKMAEKHLRSRRQIVNILIENILKEKRKTNDLSLEI